MLLMLITGSNGSLLSNSRRVLRNLMLGNWLLLYGSMLLLIRRLVMGSLVNCLMGGWMSGLVGRWMLLGYMLSLWVRMVRCLLNSLDTVRLCLHLRSLRSLELLPQPEVLSPERSDDISFETENFGISFVDDSVPFRDLADGVDTLFESADIFVLEHVCGRCSWLRLRLRLRIGWWRVRGGEAH